MMPMLRRFASMGSWPRPGAAALLKQGKGPRRPANASGPRPNHFGYLQVRFPCRDVTIAAHGGEWQGKTRMKNKALSAPIGGREVEDRLIISCGARNCPEI